MKHGRNTDMNPKLIGQIILEANAAGIKFPVDRKEAQKWRNVSFQKISALVEMGLVINTEDHLQKSKLEQSLRAAQKRVRALTTALKSFS